MEERKRVRLILKNNFCYTGEIQEQNEKKLILKDKFGVTVVIDQESIMLLEEVQ
jgi:Fe-S cluster assembly iron-binding protein IscA